MHRSRFIVRLFIYRWCIMERHTKLRRLAAVGVPHSQLVEIIEKLRADPIDDDDIDVNRWTFHRSFDELWVAAGLSISLPTDTGEFKWQCLSLPKTLQLMVRSSGPFKDILATLFRSNPCTIDSPYHLALYADEVSPQTVCANVCYMHVTSARDRYARMCHVLGHIGSPGLARLCLETC